MTTRRGGDLLERARDQRTNATPAERALWRELRQRRHQGAKFRRQHVIGHAVVDFYCPKAKLVVELDGGQHSERPGRRYDLARTAELERRGLMVLRFWNHDVLDGCESVLDRIDAVLSQRLRPG